jgi:hypothetical protein
VHTIPRVQFMGQYLVLPYDNLPHFLLTIHLHDYVFFRNCKFDNGSYTIQHIKPLQLTLISVIRFITIYSPNDGFSEA